MFLKLLPLALFLLGVRVLYYIINTWPEAVVASIGSCIGAVIACLVSYHYAQYRQEYHIDYALNKKLKKRLRSIPCSDIQKIMGLLGNWQDIGKKVP